MYKGDVLLNLPVALNISDANGDFIYSNEQVSSLTGYSPDELMGKHWSVLYSDQTYKSLIPKFEIFLANKKWSGQVTIQRKNGTSFRPMYLCRCYQPAYSRVYSII